MMAKSAETKTKKIRPKSKRASRSAKWKKRNKYPSKRLNKIKKAKVDSPTDFWTSQLSRSDGNKSNQSSMITSQGPYNNVSRDYSRSTPIPSRCEQPVQHFDSQSYAPSSYGNQTWLLPSDLSSQRSVSSYHNHHFKPQDNSLNRTSSFVLKPDPMNQFTTNRVRIQTSEADALFGAISPVYKMPYLDRQVLPISKTGINQNTNSSSNSTNKPHERKMPKLGDIFSSKDNETLFVEQSTDMDSQARYNALVKYFEKEGYAAKEKFLVLGTTIKDLVDSGCSIQQMKDILQFNTDTEQSIFKIILDKVADDSKEITDISAKQERDDAMETLKTSKTMNPEIKKLEEKQEPRDDPHNDTNQVKEQEIPIRREVYLMIGSGSTVKQIKEKLNVDDEFLRNIFEDFLHGQSANKSSTANFMTDSEQKKKSHSHTEEVIVINSDSEELEDIASDIGRNNAIGNEINREMKNNPRDMKNKTINEIPKATKKGDFQPNTSKNQALANTNKNTHILTARGDIEDMNQNSDQHVVAKQLFALELKKFKLRTKLEVGKLRSSIKSLGMEEAWQDSSTKSEMLKLRNEIVDDINEFFYNIYPEEYTPAKQERMMKLKKLKKISKKKTPQNLPPTNIGKTLQNTNQINQKSAILEKITNNNKSPKNKNTNSSLEFIDTVIPESNNSTKQWDDSERKDDALVDYSFVKMTKVCCLFFFFFSSKQFH